MKAKKPWTPRGLGAPVFVTIATEKTDSPPGAYEEVSTRLNGDHASKASRRGGPVTGVDAAETTLRQAAEAKLRVQVGSGLVLAIVATVALWILITFLSAFLAVGGIAVWVFVAL